ncbi:uncharacterized protein LOC132265285 [Phlebotomus argentipes]|uniref:uncharacterized protein LOC132265285 n=1 Tax=Phlebotomus argentipes TaxID=94469 RepID=UPI002892FEDA|nr:uncharacterized protein LOC132265285 [Phlebotomus argentipes]
MSFRPPWKNQEQQNAAWVHQGGFRNKQFHRRGGSGSGGPRDPDRRSPWAGKQETNRIPSLLDLPPAVPLPGIVARNQGQQSIWEQPPPVFEANSPQQNRQFNTPDSQIGPQPVPAPALLPPPPVPLSLLLQGEIWDVNNGQTRGNAPVSTPSQGTCESQANQEEPERKPRSDDLIDSLNRYHEEFRASKYGHNSSENIQPQNATVPQKDNKLDSVTQKLLNRVTLMEKHNIKQVINDPEPKYESALKKRATQLIRANVRQRLRHFSVEERAESESEFRDIEPDLFVDSDKMPEAVFNEIKSMIGLEANNDESNSLFLDFDKAIEENMVQLETFDASTENLTETIVVQEEAIKENVTLSRVNRESTEILGDANTLDSVMNEAVDANALSPLMVQNDDDHNIRAFADNGIAICTPGEDLLKEDKAQTNLLNNISSNNTNEAMSKELQSYKIPKRQRYPDNRHSRRDDRRFTGRRSYDPKGHRYDRHERGRSRSRGSGSHERDNSRSYRENFADRHPGRPSEMEKKPPEPERKSWEQDKRPPEPEMNRKPPPGGSRPPEENRKRPNPNQPNQMGAKRKRMDKSNADAPQRQWLSPGEKKCLPMQYKNKCVQTQYQPTTPTKSLAERELKIFHEMKQIDISLMEMQRKKIEIDEQIQKLQSELMSIEMQSMKLQNTRFDLVNRILSIPVGHVDALIESDVELTPVKKPKNVRFEEKKLPMGSAAPKSVKVANMVNNLAEKYPETAEVTKKKKKPPKPKKMQPSVEESQVKTPKIEAPKPNQKIEAPKLNQKIEVPKPSQKIEAQKPNPQDRDDSKPKEKKPMKGVKVKIGPAKKKSPVPVAKVPEEPQKVATPEPPVASAQDLSKVLKECSVQVLRYTQDMIDEATHPVEGTKETRVGDQPSDLAINWKDSVEFTVKSQILRMEVAKGYIFAIAESDPSLYRFSWDGEKQMKSVQLHEKNISSFACHNELAFTVSSDGFVRKTDCEEFKGSIGEFYCGSALESITSAPWGQLYIVRHDRKILVFDSTNLEDNQELNCDTEGEIIGLVSGEVDGQRILAVAEEGSELSIRKAESGELIKKVHLEWTIDHFSGHSQMIHCGVNGTDLVHCRIMTGEETSRCNIKQKVIDVKRLSKLILILCENGTVSVWNCEENEMIGVLKGPEDGIKGFDVANNKIFIVSSGGMFWSSELPERLLTDFTNRSNHDKIRGNSKENSEDV